MKTTECQEDTGETGPLQVCQWFSMNVSYLQKLTRKTQLPAPNSLSKLSPQRKVIQMPAHRSMN